MTTYKEMKSISFDGGSTVYNLVDATALHSSDIASTYSPTGTAPINGTGVASALSTSLSTYELIEKPLSTLSTSGSISLSDNSVNKITPSAAVTFTLPTVTDNTVFHQILVQVNMSTVYSLDVGTTYFFGGTAPDLSNAGNYNLIFEYDSTMGAWVCGALTKEQVV